ncbi:MAG: sodium:alanine symporter family protein [Bacteroidales bacterium]|nr:sodium:alanine symporter family protein [Bacteroidales bacterium]
MNNIANFLETLDTYLGSSSWFVFLLLGTGLFFTIYLRFPQFRYFKHAIRITRGRYDKASDAGDTTHFGALTAALSGTIGTGNIAGVALAIHLGGPAALFWMLITAILGMATKMVEVSLSHKYREIAPDGTVAGGPMYYMKNRLNWKVVAAIFACCTILASFGTGNLPQINSIANVFETTFGVNKLLMGSILAIVMALIIIGGIKRIANVTKRLVPFMALLYILAGIAVLITNYENILPAIFSVFVNVFSGAAATGGFLGAAFAWVFNRGVNRGLFSNEAGQGSAPIAHAAAKADEPVSEGMVSLLEPFIDTVIVCFFTGIILLSSGVWSDKVDNTFQKTDTYIVHQTDNTAQLLAFLSQQKEGAHLYFSGEINVVDGVVISPVTVIHNRSVAENVKVFEKGKTPFTGTLTVADSRITNDVTLSGKSLLHSAPLTSEAFSRSFLGDFGKYVIPLCLLLFAFSTALAWAYYGDRAVVYLFGVKWVTPFRIFYSLALILGAVVDTTLIWLFTGVAIVLMAVPNLIGILWLHKEMRSEIKKYWDKFRQEHPKEKVPKGF